MNTATNPPCETTNSKSEFGKSQIGMWLGPALALAIYLLLGSCLDEIPRRTAAAGVLMAVFWICETMPLAATALIPVALFPALGILDVESAAASFTRPVIFLFLGGFLLAQAVEQSGLHRRLALVILHRVGKRPGHLLAGLMGTSAFLSMWISNTATVVMLVPIVGSLTLMLKPKIVANQSERDFAQFEVGLFLGVAFAASIGGMGTLVGTPPNALLIGALKESGISISFGKWMLFALPFVLVYLTFLWWLLCKFVFPKSIRGVSFETTSAEQQLKAMGPMTRSEWTVCSVFLFAALAWLLREPLQSWDWLTNQLPFISRLGDASISIMAALLLFLLPVNKTGEKVLTCQSVNKLPWGVLILIGGGMSLAVAMNESGLSQVIAEQLTMFQSLPTVLLIAAIAGVTIFLTEVTSNTATTATLLPVLASLGMQMECGPLFLMIPAALAASCAFMLPVATPPNAVVFETGKVPMGSMIRYGFWLNLAGIVLITALMTLVGGLMF